MTLPSLTLEEILARAPVIPVLIIEDVAHAVPLGRALAAGGLSVLEVTLRTPVALQCVERMAGEIEDAVVGAGTVLTPGMRQAVADVGGRFAVSPGLIEGETDEGPTPLLPGIATATELMAGLAAGFTRFKLFPANVAGGVDALKAFASPFQQAKFCPTGGVNAKNAADYLALPNVVCVGGSWVAPADAVRAGDWGKITELARQAAALARPQDRAGLA
ncbi:bifunctional 4-hydroxy-2-oxoglutarate aldolase/2-dehydro-3-deoxy-phosphogluconate aldolase [Phenylobacterium sp.]|jgi:2-dehydro-3-deoxyphosphogluconate aldolase/(4S)-4-hydroxy-2-oxoglutarate aldolase|uniref:bifunctional 4-hydroxy-2-oxoglutarate aldolase/2-dehydro-3-deoxy-phosphogluconate aldolase n=1 Tax=Phenylobacterium sp. TaxID=1871053 RepID=UPI002E305DA3|nr:bifunctional 4-hydroxy-2-oxoglutarate aldolase/2-dehydro-3-deoxy-phosphogluconate aldolase [Phenylobacterium sp.]HEX4712589.1 bifunctional 4-hydroxy-2-oxoglutarate aldolase/2-dehydro-3-deoxy-phosphogluconate aldolase [Phenylobacterium sp.]